MPVVTLSQTISARDLINISSHVSLGLFATLNNTTKALLGSAFIFPGVGHLILRQYHRGLALGGMAAIATVVIMLHVIESAQQIVAQVLSGDVPADFLTIRQLVAEQQMNSSTWAVDLALAVLVMSWLIGIIDVYRTTKVSS